jgi:hypothetical protein
MTRPQLRVASIAWLAMLCTRCASSDGANGARNEVDGSSGSPSAGPESGTGATGDVGPSGDGGAHSADSPTPLGGADATASGSGDGSSESGAPVGGPSAGSVAGSQSVLQRGNDVYRRATYVEPGLTLASAATMAPDTAFNANATFAMTGHSQNQGTASVLYLEQGPAQAGCPSGATGCTATLRAAGAGLFFAFPPLGANPNIVAFDEASGLAVWTAHVATGSDGIRGTPVIDPSTRRIFVVTGNNPHLVHAVAVDTGVEDTAGGWPVSLSSATVSYNGTTFNSAAENQHGALLLLNRILYIPFGGQYGDGGNYRGWIVALNTTNPSQIAAWATQSPRSGIWGSGGLASDGTYVFGVTGDTTSVSRNQSDSQEVVRVKGLSEFTRDEASIFVPTEWQGWDQPAADLDFGASTPAYAPLTAGLNPPGLLVAPAKAGRVFVLNGADLSSGSYPTPGGHLADLVVAATKAESVYTSPTIYTSASGLHATINVGVSPANCPAGTPASNAMIISLLLQPGKSPIATEVWCAPNAGGGHMNYPPISTTSDGISNDAIVWFVNGGQLTAVDGDTGKRIFTTNGSSCQNVPSMSFPIAVKNRIVVSALGHLCSWSPNGM